MSALHELRSPPAACVPWSPGLERRKPPPPWPPSPQACFSFWEPFADEPKPPDAELQGRLRREFRAHDTAVLLVHRQGEHPEQALLHGEHALLVLQGAPDNGLLVWHLHSVWQQEGTHIGAFLAAAAAAAASEVRQCTSRHAGTAPRAALVP